MRARDSGIAGALGLVIVAAGMLTLNDLLCLAGAAIGAVGALTHVIRLTSRRTL